MQFATTETRRSTVLLMHRDCIFLHHCRAGRPDDRETFACLPSSLWGHSGQMTAEAFGRLASWSSFNIVVGRHDEFARSRVAIPQKRGTTAKSIVLHSPQSTTMTHFPPQSNTSHSRNPSLRGIAIERHAISSTHHNNRSYKYSKYAFAVVHGVYETACS